MMSARHVFLASLILTTGGMDLAAGAETPSVIDGSKTETNQLGDPVEMSGDTAGKKSDGTAQREAATRKAAQQKVVAGLILVGVLLVVGIAVLVLVVLWAHRLRRFARHSLPAQTLGDNLWYLRPSKSTLPGTAADTAPKSDQTENNAGDDPSESHTD